VRSVVQRVKRAAVSVDNEVVGAIGEGLAVLVGVAHGDSEQDAEWTARKVAELRIFSDANGKFDRSLIDIQGEVLVVSQFTLLGDARKGRRPDFTGAAAPEEAEPLVLRVVEGLRSRGLRVETGRFAATMVLEVVNDGPVSILLDSRT
jgi:D-aminoacyl-tRNA deacylase